MFGYKNPTYYRYENKKVITSSQQRTSILIYSYNTPTHTSLLSFFFTVSWPCFICLSAYVRSVSLFKTAILLGTQFCEIKSTLWRTSKHNSATVQASSFAVGLIGGHMATLSNLKVGRIYCILSKPLASL